VRKREVEKINFRSLTSSGSTKNKKVEEKEWKLKRE
jgi:hypothetical protein